MFGRFQLFSLSRPTCNCYKKNVKNRCRGELRGVDVDDASHSVYPFSDAPSCRAATQRARAKLLTLPKTPEATHKAMTHVSVVYSMIDRLGWPPMGCWGTSRSSRVVDGPGVGLRRRRRRFELQIARAHRHRCGLEPLSLDLLSTRFCAALLYSLEYPLVLRSLTGHQSSPILCHLFKPTRKG